ncbi:MAG TPA: VTT domain-containing protein [Thermoanaerobaculia bacterium]|nr:VTT domain-containing protein [Thermoanaerobaculia bacterium]
MEVVEGTNRLQTGRIIAAMVFVGAVAAIYLSPASEWLTLENVRATLDDLRSLWYGPIVFVCIYAAACVVAIPASIFVLSAGIIWGWGLGVVYALIGSMFGAAASYYVARYIGGGLLQRFGRMGVSAQKQLEKAGFRSMLILRLLGLPFPVLNFAAGVARMRFSAFMLGTFLGIIPSQFVIAYSADSIANGSLSGGDALIRVFIAAGLMGILVSIPFLVKKFATRKGLIVPEPPP